MWRRRRGEDASVAFDVLLFDIKVEQSDQDDKPEFGLDAPAEKSWSPSIVSQVASRRVNGTCRDFFGARDWRNSVGSRGRRGVPP